MPRHLSGPLLTVATVALVGEQRYRAAIRPDSPRAFDCARIAVAYSDFLVTLAGSKSEPRAGVSHNMSTDPSGTLAVEIRGPAQRVATSLITGLLEPIFEAYALDVLDFDRDRPAEDACPRISVDVWRILPPTGGTILGLLLRAPETTILPDLADVVWRSASPCPAPPDPRRFPSDFRRRETVPDRVHTASAASTTDDAICERGPLTLAPPAA